MKGKGAIFALIIGLAVTAGILMFFNKGRQPLDLTSALAADIVIEPTQMDSAGVDTKSDFLVKTSTYIDPKIVVKNISVQPEIKFTVEEQKNTSKILLVPDQPLQPDEIYRFTLDLPGSHPLKWAFQTVGAFKINGTLPRDKSTGVPTNTGIEISLNHLNVEDPEQYFEISPQVKGRFEIHKKTLVFVPENLNPSTVYTVKVKKGLKIADSSLALGEDYVFQFETQDPTQHNQNEDYLELFQNTMDFRTGTAPFIPVGYYGSREDGSPEVRVTVYHYQDAAEYIDSLREREKVPLWAYNSRSKYLADTKKLSRQEAFSVKLKRYGDETYVEFPQALPAGYYLAEVSLGDVVRQLWFQVSDLAVYCSVLENRTLVWVNDLTTGVPASGALVHLGGNQEKTVTDEKGLALFSTPSGIEQGVYATVASAGKEAVASVFPNGFSPLESDERNSAQNYWKYFYLDRGLFKPDDTVHFWGLIKPRHNDEKAPGQVTISLTKWQDWQETVLIDDQEVEVKRNIFTGDFPLPNLVPGYYNLTVKLGDQVIAEQGFDVQTYTKPAYKIDVVADQKAIYAGDTAHFKINATCFENTTVPQVKLNYHLDQSGELTTDTMGQADLTYTPSYRDDDSGPVQYRYLDLNAALPESGEITAGTSIVVLNNDINIKADGERENKTGTVNIQLEKLTVDKVNQGEADPWDEDAFVAGNATRRPVTVAVFRQVWDKIPDGDYYDFITKTVEKRFRYQERKVLVTQSQVTTNRQGKGSFHFAAEPEKSYFIELTAKDDQGNLTRTEIYLPGSDYPRSGEYSWYHLEDDKDGTAKYRDGEQMVLTVYDNESKVPDRAGSFLFYTARQGLMDYQVQDSASFQTVFSPDLIPNFWAKGVYFDGSMYHEAPEYLAMLDEKEKALNIKITTDQKEYRPKDKVRLSVEVRDDQGRPLAATVNLNLVDEALFMLSPQQADILGSLYGDFLSSGIIMTGSTHKDPTNHTGGAEQGGEGGSGRRDFKDAAFFETLTTGRNGKASVTFQVPDNLTSWRLTCQAVTPDLQAGTETARIPVKLPFFADLILNDRYLTGDEPVVLVRSLGDQLQEGDAVDCTVKLTGGEEKYEKTLTGKAFETLSLPLPALKKGNYEITVTLKSEGKSDQLTRSFAAVDSFMTQEKISHGLLSGETKVQGAADGLTQLVFADEQRSQYLTMLCSLAGAQGSRIEQKVVPQLAAPLLKEYFPKVTPFSTESDSFDPSRYQTAEGGISVLPYAGADLEVSAQIASLCGDRFDLPALKAYFYRIVDDPGETRERGVMALYGLASLGEPVLQEMELVAGEKDLTVKERLYLILSFNELGNEQPARKMLKELLKKYGEENGPFKRINTGSDKEDVGEITSLAALAAGRLMFEEAGQLQQYVLENPPKEHLTYLEQIKFLQDGLPRLEKKAASFSYSTGDREHQVTLTAGETFTLMLDPEKMKALKFSNIVGTIGLTTIYQGAFTPPDQPGLDGVTVTRDYRVAGKPSRQFHPGDLVEVAISWKLGPKAPDGTYQITDYLPAGLKLVERPYNWDVKTDHLGWPVEINGQKAVFLVSESGSFRYYARIVNGGIFTAQSAVIQHAKNGTVYAMSAPNKVEIK